MEPLTSGGPATIGVVAIGRNEGERLRACLETIVPAGGPVVYVDSGSSDGSVALARARGAGVVELDPARPFTAARGRNEGFRALRRAHPALELVQFLDGDCRLVDGFLERARAVLEAHPRVAIVAGRRRELHPEASPYNRLCDLEWNTPVGTADECGGDFLARAAAFEAVGGFDEARIAGEEPELCARLRAAGWSIERIDHDMTLHDADMHRFSQWWRRSLRAGHAAADNWPLVGRDGSRPKRRMALRALFWALALPLTGLALLAAGLALTLPWLALAGLALPLLGWTALYLRVLSHERRLARATPSDARLYAAACVVGKFPEVLGVLTYLSHRVRGRRAGLVEYKRPAPVTRERA